MKITRSELRQIIFEERELAVEKQRLRDIINEEYLNVLQEAQNDEAFYKLIRDAVPGDKVYMRFLKKVQKGGVVDVFVPGKTYVGTVPSPKKVEMGHEKIVFVGDKTLMSKKDLIKKIKEKGGASVVDLKNSKIEMKKFAGKQITIAKAMAAISNKKAVAKAPVEKTAGVIAAAKIWSIGQNIEKLKKQASDYDFYKLSMGYAAVPKGTPTKYKNKIKQPSAQELNYRPLGPSTYFKDEVKKTAATPEPAKAPEAEKKTEPAPEGPEKVTGTPGEQIDIPEKKVPGKDWYRASGRDIAFHVSDSKWVSEGYPWVPRGNEPGPPGWLGVEVGPVITEAPEDPSAVTQLKKRKRIVHFYHPDWKGWKKNGGEKVPTHKIDPKGASMRVAPAQERPKAKPKKDATGLDFVQLFKGLRKWISKNLNEIPDWKKLLSVIEIKPEQLEYLKKVHQEMSAAGDGKAPVASALGVLQKEFNKARSAGTKYEPNFEALKKRFNLSDDQLETVRNAYTELVTAPGQFDPAEKKPEAAAEKEKPASVKVDPDSEWVGKSMREVVKLTKAGLKKVLRRSVRANNYGGDGWFRGGLLKLRQRHPLRKKYAKWYKDYRKRKRAARKARRRR